VPRPFWTSWGGAHLASGRARGSSGSRFHPDVTQSNGRLFRFPRGATTGSGARVSESTCLGRRPRYRGPWGSERGR